MTACYQEGTVDTPNTSSSFHYETFWEEMDCYHADSLCGDDLTF
jgi:hypothetical protein